MTSFQVQMFLNIMNLIHYQLEKMKDPSRVQRKLSFKSLLNHIMIRKLISATQIQKANIAEILRLHYEIC